MGKKRKGSNRQAAPSGPKELDPADARLGPITSFEDVADSGDEYWMKQDMIPLDGDGDNDEPHPKRRRHWEEQDKVLEESEEDILGHDDSDDEYEDGELVHDLERIRAHLKRKKKGRTLDSDEEAPKDGDDDERDEEGWEGATKDEFYNADIIDTEEAAVAEETEALKLQQKKLSKMTEADFIFDQDEWAKAEEDSRDRKTATEMLNDADVMEGITPEERYQVLQARYPEFDYLVGEFEELQPQVDTFRQEADGKPSKSLQVVKYWTAGCYVAALASYFAILTSPARDDIGTKKAMDPEELREHEVMETLVKCRDQWIKVQKFRSARKPESSQPQVFSLVDFAISTPDNIDRLVETTASRKPTKKEKAAIAKEIAKETEKAKRAKAVEESIADLSGLLTSSKKASKGPIITAPAPQNDNNSDFGEEEVMDSKYAEEKAARKKSLRFYTSQIVQKANKRVGASKNVGGDTDIPYRERLKDRQARLIAEAQKRGSRAGPGADLDGNSSDEEDKRAAKDIRGGDSDDGYYNMVTNAAQQKKVEKAAKYEAYAAASKRDLVVEQEEIGEDGKRKITYAIQKNKGLTPHRNKINRNPRVKKKKAYAEKQKKWKTVRPTFQGAPQGGYQGELSGIKKGLVKVQRL